MKNKSLKVNHIIIPMDIIILFYVLVIIYKLLFYIIEKQFQTKESKNKNKNIIINFEMAFLENQYMV